MQLEIVNPTHAQGSFRVALWDFDGTISLFRGGWQQIMVEMMVERLAATGTTESRERLAELAENWVVTLNGKPTIHQMLKLAEEVAARGGKPCAAEAYCSDYQDQLLARVDERMASIERGEKEPLEHGVAGVSEMLQALSQRGIALVLASGTEHEYVARELEAIGLQKHFGQHVYAPHGHDTAFSKRSVIERLLVEFNISGQQLVGFGDGIVETAEVKRVGGCAVGVASDEVDSVNRLDAAKRARLIEAGADLIVPNFLNPSALLHELGL